MTGAGGLVARLLDQALAAACRCTGRGAWKMDVSHTFAGVVVRAEVRSS